MSERLGGVSHGSTNEERAFRDWLSYASGGSRESWKFVKSAARSQSLYRHHVLEHDESVRLAPNRQPPRAGGRHVRTFTLFFPRAILTRDDNL